MATTMRIHAATVVTSETRKQYDFARPLTVITGPVGAGKSSLLMLIKHALGGRAALTPAVAENVSQIIVSLEIEGSRLALRRSVPDLGGAVEVLDPFTQDVEQRLPVRARDGAVSISDRLLELLGIPRERVPTRRRQATAETVALTFQNLLSYLYVEAREIDRSIAGHLEFYSDRARRHLFELMFRLIDPDLNALRRGEGELNEAIKRYREEVATVRRFLDQTQTPTSEQLIEERRRILQDLDVVEDSLRAVRVDSNASRAAAEAIYAEGDRALAEERGLTTRAEQLAQAVTARRALVAQLELDRVRLEQARSAGRVIGRFEFVVCPRCFQDLDSARASDGHCIVCLQPDQTYAAAIGEDHALDRIGEQLDDTRSALARDEAAAERAAALARTARLHLHLLRQRIDAITRDTTAPLLSQTAELSGRRATLAARLDRIDEMHALWSRFAELEEQLRQAEEQRRQVRAAIKQRGQQLAAARSRVTAFDDAFRRELGLLRVPGVERASIDPSDYLPRINGAQFEQLQASGGGMLTAVHLAYSIALLTTAVDDPNISLPSLLIIDSPQKAIGQNPDDVALSQRIYNRFLNLADVYQQRIQLVVADNSLPTTPPHSDWSAISTIDLGYEDRAMVPGVWHPGPSAATIRVEDREPTDL